MTTSSYAVLALLSLRPWKAYELTQQAKRSLRYAWPRSERLLYTEPKKLVELGYASTYEETTGNRTSNVYEITDAGRDAMQEWTRTRTEPPRIEVEALLRVLFADHGEREDLLRALDELEADIGEHHEEIVALMESYLHGGHPFPDRTHLSVLFATFQLEIFRAIERWVAFARDEVEEWPTTAGLGMTPRTEAITRTIAGDRSPLEE